MGDWERALNQLNVSADLDPANLLMAQVCRPAIGAEALRAEIFAGLRTPLIFGEPEDWLGWLVESNKLLSQGHADAAAELREKAFEQAPATSGTINGQAVDWIADADQRFGPVFELMMDGKYYWVPAKRIAKIEMEPPDGFAGFDLGTGDVHMVDGREGDRPDAGALSGDGDSWGMRLQKLSRKTDWLDQGGAAIGLGQRLLTTDTTEVPLLEVRELVLNTMLDAVLTPGEAHRQRRRRGKQTYG